VGADYCGRCGKEVSGFALIEGACPDCLGAESDLDGIARAGIYSGSLRKMILALKFKGRSELDSVLGELIDTAQAASELCQRCEIFVPVPMHWSRRLVRGENHAELLAKRIKAARGKIGGGLVRARRTQKQSELKGAASRKRNVAGAFCVRKGHKFKGRRICLVDDIKTSGATLNECARVLKEAGATEVYGLVAAVAGQEAG
jgi:ComF family protein